MTDTVAGPGSHGEVAAEELLARRRRRRRVGVVIALVLVVAVVLVVGALSGWGQTERPVSTFVAQNQFQQLAHDSAFDMGRRMSAEGRPFSSYEGACRMFAAMQGGSSGSDTYGEVPAALYGCADGLDAFYAND